MTMMILALLACGNQPPVGPSIAIDPGQPLTTDDLQVVLLAESSDPNGDEISYRYRWFVDGTLRDDLTGAEVEASATAKGEVWKVVVTPSDGELDGSPGEAEVTIGNTPPVAAALELTATEGTTVDEVTANASATDADGDPVVFTYAWSSDTGGAHTGATLPAEATTKGDTILLSTCNRMMQTHGTAKASRYVIWEEMRKQKLRSKRRKG